MHRIDTATASNNRFVDGNANQGIKGTQVDSSWLNSVQEEICNVATEGGSLSKSDNTQVRAAIKVMIPKQFSPCNSSESLSVSATSKQMGESVTIKKGDFVDLMITADISSASLASDDICICKQNETTGAIHIDSTIKGKQSIRITYTAAADYTGKVVNVYFVSGTSTATTTLVINGFIVHNT